jgi:hypothetical protein
MSANLRINWADKKNSPLLADLIAKYGAEYCMTAEEINQLRDAVNEMADVQETTFMGVAEPASTPAGAGKAFWISTQAGLYPNHGGFTVADNSFALISRNEVGGFSISQTALNLTPQLLPVKIVSLTTPSGVPADGDEWILYTS